MFIRILCVAAATFFCGSLPASKIIFSAVNQTNTTTIIPVEECCAGHQASLWGLAYKQGENITVQLTFYDVDGGILRQSQVHYNNQYSSNDKKEQCSLEYALTLKKGNYQLVRGGNSEQELVSVTESVILVCWDCAGGDTAVLKDELQEQLDDLISELEGTVNTKTKALQDEIGTLKKQLQDAITQNAEDQAVLIRRIEEYESQINNLISDLQYNLSRLEREQAEYLSQLQVIKVQYEKDAQMLELKISNLDSKYAAEVTNIKSDVTKIEQELSTLESKFLSGDQALKTQIDSLTSQHNSLQNQVNIAETQHRNDISAIQSQIDAKTLQIQTEHQADVKRLEQSIGNVDSKYATEVSHINTEIGRINSQISQVISDYKSGDAALQTKVDSLQQKQTTLQSQLDVLGSTHAADIAEVKNLIDAKTTQLQSNLDAEVKLLEQELKAINDTYRTAVNNITTEISDINKELNQIVSDYAAADKDLQSQITTLNNQYQAQQNQLSNLSSTHDRDVADLQKQITEKNAALTEKINTAVSDLQKEISALEVKHREDTQELKNKLVTVEAKLEAEVNKLEQTDKDLYDKISDLKEKQADYYARLEVMKVTHEKDMEALQKELATLEKAHKDDVAAINADIDQINAEADKLKAQHEKDVAAIRGEIDAVVDKLDAEVQKIYLELEARKTEFAEYQAKVTESIDSLQLQITMLDKAVTERLKNLENRIRYAVYSDEKLADLVKEYTQAIQDKEREIADLDLEIREMEELGRDTTAKQETRDRKLSELLALRNELTDIQFAIQIRNDDSEFAVHEAEIEKLKAELAALRQSSELLLQQLEEKLIATENRLLALLDEIQAEAAAENAVLRKDLEDFKALVQVFIDTLREEQLSGDEILRKLIAEMDESHRALLSQLDSDFVDRLEKLKFEQDVQFENLRSTINNIAYQQRFNSGSSGSYGLPQVRDEEVPSDNRDLRVSPTESLTIY